MKIWEKHIAKSREFLAQSHAYIELASEYREMMNQSDISDERFKCLEELVKDLCKKTNKAVKDANETARKAL